MKEFISEEHRARHMGNVDRLQALGMTHAQAWEAVRPPANSAANKSPACLDVANSANPVDILTAKGDFAVKVQEIVVSGVPYATAWERAKHNHRALFALFNSGR